MIFSFGKTNNNKLKEAAKKEYETALAKANDKSRLAKQLCLRMALRCRTNIDKLFVEAAQKTELHEAESLAALAANKRPPDPPLASCYQLVKIPDGYIYTYLPDKHAETIFRIAVAYQTQKMSRGSAIERTQVVADAVCEELGVVQQFQVLQFLIDADEENGAASSSPNNDTQE
jgi:response regulator RpfG family c-di-GMP phosphodiesterase